MSELEPELQKVCKLLCGCWASNPSPLGMQPGLLTTESFSLAFFILLSALASLTEPEAHHFG